MAMIPFICVCTNLLIVKSAWLSNSQTFFDHNPQYEQSNDFLVQQNQSISHIYYVNETKKLDNIVAQPGSKTKNDNHPSKQITEAFIDQTQIQNTTLDPLVHVEHVTGHQSDKNSLRYKDEVTFINEIGNPEPSIQNTTLDRLVHVEHVTGHQSDKNSLKYLDEVAFMNEITNPRPYRDEPTKIEPSANLSDKSRPQKPARSTISDIKQENSPIFIRLKEEELKFFRQFLKPVHDERIIIFDIDKTLYREIPGNERETQRGKNDPKNTVKSKPVNDKSINSVRSPQNYSTTNKENRALNFQTLLSKLQTNQELKDFLDSLPYKKFCFTNNTIQGSKKILEKLGVLSCFEVVFAKDNTIYKSSIVKPNKCAYEFVSNLLKIANNKNIIFFDDEGRNIIGAKSVGWNAVRIRKNDELIDRVKKTLEKLLDEII
ncbi:pyrimidine 5 -nucleotidase [Pseudoloma neurophilia]|uniref:Pyrimidine 5-nucleotidase n=1 Tax=Pseudoloma neurophilia TaxID=146866 RepID=A0A0R0LWA1_9MICR|nr:pyrimidine 5 -nucleotidase [Pseudoloma neurophilia]